VKYLKRHLSVANLISCIALFVALSSVAYAATNLTNRSVKTRHIANGAVTTPKLRGGAVTTPKLRNGAVVATKIAPGQIGTNQLSDGGVRSADLGGGVVTEGKIKNGAVTESKLASNAVSAGKLQNGAVTSAKLSSSLLAQLLKNLSYATKASESNNTEATKTVTAECPTGKQAIGGGAKVVGGGTDLIAITESAPTAPNAEGKRTGWTAVARAETGGGGTNWSVEAYAVCAEL
jgi:trimeric autotransporter adhesin